MMSNQGRPSPLLLASYHEAGHACAAIHFGIALVSISVGHDGHGLTTRAWATSDPFVEFVSAYAGPCAELAVTARVELQSDEAAMRKAMAQMSDAEYKRAMDYAKRLVRTEWRLITRIAEALHKSEYLMGVEVDALAESKVF